MPVESYLPDVRNQYEQYPYPPRDPAEEKTRLVQTWLDFLAPLNHFCFEGKQTFQDGFRCLVAGGGTGDATIFLAEQLKGTNATVVHLDMSEMSLSIAKQRAAARALDNIEFVHASILDLPTLGFESFHYINCCGVLHHLEDPDAGLEALLSVLAAGGGIGLMLYGKIGRTGVYQLQDALRLITGDHINAEEKVKVAKNVLERLPPTNWYQHSKAWISDVEEFGDHGIYDLLLHSQDRAYTIPELYEWLVDDKSLHIDISSEFRGHVPYDSSVYLPPAEQEMVKDKPLREREAIAELMSGVMVKHYLYVTREPAVAALTDAEQVPYFSFCMKALDIRQMADQIEKNPGKVMTLNLYQKSNRPGMSFNYLPGVFAHHLLRAIDGQNSIQEIVTRVLTQEDVKKRGFTEQQVNNELQQLIKFFQTFGGALLRHKTVAPFVYLE